MVEMHGDGLIQRPLLVGQITEVGVLPGHGLLAPVPAAHAGVQSLPAAQALHLHVGPVAVGPIASLGQEVCIILSQDDSFSELVVDWYPGGLQELFPNGADRDDIDHEAPVPDILGSVYRLVVGRLDEDRQIVGEEDVVEEPPENGPDNVDQSAGQAKHFEVSRYSEPGEDQQ